MLAIDPIFHFGSHWLQNKSSGRLIHYHKKNLFEPNNNAAFISFFQVDFG